MRDLARRLLVPRRTDSHPQIHEVVLFSDALRTTLTRFAGSEGFASLLRRALILASAEVPALQSVKVGADGRLEGFEQLSEDTGTDAAAALTAYLLGLLVTFLGESLTLRLLQEAGLDTTLDELHSAKELHSPKEID